MVFLQKNLNMVIFPKAKINIGLRIIEKRPDGFHNLQTIFYPVCFCDALEFVVPKEFLDKDALAVTGLLSGCLPDDNLIIKAVKRLREKSKIPFLKIHLHKAIPAGAGLGGGSSDAANILRSLNRYFNLNISSEELKEISLSLGSDCPFFIESEPAYAEGRGEILSPVNTIPDEYHLLIIVPGIAVNTKEAYSDCRPYKGESNLPEYYNRSINEWKDLIFNDFEKSIFLRYPQIASIKESLYKMGAVYSSLSGSGSAVYGIFNKKPVVPENLRSHIVYSGIL
jgi:4-diphosphocytidyl-2-C-methyl-D-erythritol kinase